MIGVRLLGILLSEILSSLCGLNSVKLEFHNGKDVDAFPTVGVRSRPASSHNIVPLLFFKSPISNQLISL